MELDLFIVDPEGGLVLGLLFEGVLPALGAYHRDPREGALVVYAVHFRCLVEDPASGNGDFFLLGICGFSANGTLNVH